MEAGRFAEVEKDTLRIDRKSEQAVVLTVPFPSEKRLEEGLYSGMESEEIQIGNV